MNTLLTKHIEKEDGKTREQSLAAYELAWGSSKYLLRPLHKMLLEQKKLLTTVKDEDFNIPNHYGKLMFVKGREQEVDLLLSLLPKSLDD